MKREDTEEVRSCIGLLGFSCQIQLYWCSEALVERDAMEMDIICTLSQEALGVVAHSKPHLRAYYSCLDYQERQMARL